MNSLSVTVISGQSGSFPTSGASWRQLQASHWWPHWPVGQRSKVSVQLAARDVSVQDKSDFVAEAERFTSCGSKSRSGGGRDSREGEERRKRERKRGC